MHLKNGSCKRANTLYGKNPTVLMDTTIGQKNYCYGEGKIGQEFENWFNQQVEQLLILDNRWVLKTVSERCIDLKITTITI